MLAPLLRSDVQGRLLAELYLHPERERTTTELARQAETTMPNASRELRRLVDSGFLLARTSGRNRYLRANTEHPLFEPVAEIVGYAYGPVAVLGPLLSDISGLTHAFIYGSWAARLMGEVGADPQDIDLLVVGDGIEQAAVDAAAESARRRLGREVNPRLVSTRAWGQKSDLFLRHLYDRPLVSIRLETSSE